MSEPEDTSRSAREPWFRPEEDAWGWGQPTPPEPPADRTGWQNRPQGQPGQNHPGQNQSRQSQAGHNQPHQGQWAHQAGPDQTGLHPGQQPEPQRFRFTQPDYGQPPSGPTPGTGPAQPHWRPHPGHPGEPGGSAPSAWSATSAGSIPSGMSAPSAADLTGAWRGPGHPASGGSPAYPQSQPSPYATANPSVVFPPQQPSEQATPTKGATIAGLPTKAIVAMVIGAVALAGIIMLGVSQVQRMTSPAPSIAPAEEGLSRPAPPGWSQHYAWSVDTTTRSLAVGANRVAYVDGSGSLHLLDADSGAPVFTSQTTDATTDAEPFIAMAQGVPVTGFIDRQQLYIWPLNARNGTEPRQVTLAPKATLYQQGGGLLVATRTERWVVSPTGALDPVQLPGDHVALAATPDGNILSAPPKGSWMFSSPNTAMAPQVVRPQGAPEGTTSPMEVIYSSRGVILAWGETADPAIRSIGLFEATSGRLLAQSRLPTEVVSKGLDLTASPKGEFASAGPLLVRLSDGRTETVERWSTLRSDSKNLYGTRDGAKMFWNGELPPMEMDQKAVIPWGMSDKRFAIVMDPLDTTRVRVGALTEG